MNKNKKVIFDIILNIVAAALPVGMLQLIIYPKVAKALGGQEYGLMLTIYSIWMLFSFPLGNVLNNIKLLKQTDYKGLGDEGDIAILLRKWLAVNSIIIFISIWCYCGRFSLAHIFIGTIVSIFMLLKAYLEVGFRIELNYVAVLINNALLSFGFLAGYLFFLVTELWEYIFLLGYVFSCLYCMIKTDLIKEVPKKTALYNIVNKDAYSLVFASVIKSLTIYADKLVLYPLMGGFAVSVYYTATILGKIAGMLTGPINSVFLSYIARWDKTKANVFTKVLFVGFVICVIGYGLTLLLARPVIGLLFPQWLEEVADIMPLTTVTIMLGILTSILSPFVLKYCKMQWQAIISFIGSIVYFASALILWHFMGLKGFCIGTIIGSLVQLLLMIAVYYKSIGKVI